MDIDYPVLAFYAFAALAVLPALAVLFTRDIVRMAFWLMGAFGGFAGLYLLLGADLLAVMQVMVYVGGILILMLFGIMLTRKAGDPKGPSRRLAPGRVLGGVFAAGLIFAGIFYLVRVTPWVRVEKGLAPTTVGIGDLIMTDFLLPFEVTGLLLTLVLVGATYIVRRSRLGGEEAGAEAGAS